MKQKILIGIGLVFVILQFFGAEKTNPPEAAPLYIEDEAVVKIFERSCDDCHTNRTNWPWYSYVAPISWYVVDDVDHGRKEMNFSIFENYSKKRQIHKIEEIKEEIEKGKMPMDEYLITHPDAELSDEDKRIVYAWVDAKLASYEAQKTDTASVQ